MSLFKAQGNVKVMTSHSVRCFLIFLLLAFGVGRGLAENGPEYRDVVLTANLQFENRGAEAVLEQIVRLTLPADIPNQQQVLRIKLPAKGNFQWRSHPNQVDRYIEGKIVLPPNSTTPLQVQTTVRLLPFDYRVNKGNSSRDGNSNFLRPTSYIESTATEVIGLAARVSAQYSKDEDRLLAAFRYPQETLEYRKDIGNQGALFGLRNGYGDCTEYAAIFIATARAMGFPARLTSEFNFENNEAYDQPNHHAAEVFLNGQWIPVDPNLAIVRNSAYGFGTAGTHKVVLKRDGSWVWSSSTRGVSKNYHQNFIKATLQWSFKQSP